MNSDLNDKLRSYYGPNQYLNALRHVLESGGELNKSQVLFAEKLLISHVIKSDDTSLLPEETILDFKTNWNKYSKRPPFEFQKEDINWLLNKERAILGLDMGLGKAQPLNAKILTPNGYTYMKDIQKGDVIINSQGLTSKVTGVYPQGIKSIYKITFTDKTSVECCEDHLWYVETPVHKFLQKKGKVISTKELLKKGLHYHNGNTKFFIPVVRPIVFDTRQLPLNPYLLGCLLGDGSMSTNSVSFTSMDNSLIEELKTMLPENVCLKKNKSKYAYSFCKTTGTKNNLTQICKELKLLGHKSVAKFIPDLYKYSSIEQRISLLQGLIDTDGYVSKDGLLQFYTSSPKLKEDVVFLIQSLGGVCRTKNLCPTYQYKGERKTGLTSYSLTISLPPEIIPSRLTRKFLRYKPHFKYKPFRGIKDISFVRKDYAQCISVDAKDHLYITDNCTLTHNTTITTIAAIESSYKKILIVCPASLKLNWKKEIETFTDSSNISILDKKFTPAKFTITNYESLPKFLKEIEKHKFELVIGDEAHYCKNLQSKRTKNFTKIANKAKRVWLLTGTPIANKPIDFYSLLKICKHELGKNKQAYGEQFCGGVKTFFGWDFNGASNLKQLHLKTKNVLKRRKKEDTLELPPKTRTPIYLELTNRKGYDSAVTEYLLKKQNELEAQLKLIEYELTGNLKNKEYTDKLVELSVLRKFTALEKIKDKSLFELVDDVVAQGKKIVIFTNYLDVIDAVKEHYQDDCLTLDGRLSLEERNSRIELFQSGKGPSIVVCNLAIASVGLTLTQACVAIMNDLSWSPSVMMQAEDRIFRIGQDKSVDILYPTYDNSIESIMFDVLKEKIFNINQAIEGKTEGLSLTGDITSEVYNKLKLIRK